jgi:8-oxo-dGTP pyrophosphatase MutT (NUDIX family)
VVKASDAVAAVICLPDNRYLLQHRDDRPGIWYPGHWGCFGGAVDPGESPQQALMRELAEELEFRPAQVEYLTRFDFDFSFLDMGRHYRIYYVVRMTRAEQAAVVLHEGQAVASFDLVALASDMLVTPYDLFALHLHGGSPAAGRLSRPSLG